MEAERYNFKCRFVGRPWLFLAIVFRSKWALKTIGGLVAVKIYNNGELVEKIYFHQITQDIFI